MQKELTIEALTKIAAETAVDKPRQMKHKVGTYGRQGNIYIHPVAAAHKHGEATKDTQLAVGEGRGSRHIVEGDVKVFLGTTLPSTVTERTFLGPMIEVGSKGATITHPEHAHVKLDAGFYQITHQMDARTLQRVRD